MNDDLTLPLYLGDTKSYFLCNCKGDQYLLHYKVLEGNYPGYFNVEFSLKRTDIKDYHDVKEFRHLMNLTVKTDVTREELYKYYQPILDCLSITLDCVDKA